MGKIVGIDLGTTTSALSYLTDLGRPEIVANADGERIMPSAVYFASGDRVLTGEEAIRSRQEDASKAVRWIKREMGNENYLVNIDGSHYSPAEISSFIIKKLIQDARLSIGDISDVLITVPANFEDAARNATINAGKIAGVNVIGLVNEPTAAAYYYAVVRNIQGKTLIFDLGGGTLDVTVAEISNRDVRIINSKGDRNLGGFNFDQLLVKYFQDYYREKNGGELFTNDEERAIVEDYAEDTKKSLSRRQSVNFRLQGNSGVVIGELTREKFAEIIDIELARIQLLVECTLDEANETPDSIEHVILVGGSTRLPAVRDLLENIFGTPPELMGNVDEVVSLGAALCAGSRMIDEKPNDVSVGIRSALNNTKSFVDVCNHSYGTIAVNYIEEKQTQERRNNIIIPKNTPIPCSRTEDFYTINDGQEFINAIITQGEDSDPDLVSVIWEQEFQLPPNTPKESTIRVTYFYDKDQRMDCEFEHLASGKKLRVQVDTQKVSKSTNAISSKKLSVMDIK